MADSLSEIENKVLSLVIECKTNSEIAEETGYSERHIYRILRKLYRKFKADKKIEIIKSYIISQKY